MSASREDGASSRRGNAAFQPAQTDSTGGGLGSEDAMTEDQATTLRRLSQDALEPEAFSRDLSRAEAQRRIEALKAKLQLQDGPPHTL